MSGCPAMLDAAGTFTSSSSSSAAAGAPPFSAAGSPPPPPPLDILELNGGKEPVGILQPLRDLARTIDDAPLLEGWTAGFPGETDASRRSPPTMARADDVISFHDMVRDSPVAMTGIIGEEDEEEVVATRPTAPAVALSQGSLYGFGSPLGGPLNLSSDLASNALPPDSAGLAGQSGYPGTTTISSNHGNTSPTLWNSNTGLEAIEALLKIQQAALG